METINWVTVVMTGAAYEVALAAKLLYNKREYHCFLPELKRNRRWEQDE